MESKKGNEYKAFWEGRYAEEVYSYGKAPNEFFKQWIQKFEPGSILLPADGEGRNGVFAAKLGWDVTSNDFSFSAKEKAIKLASEENVSLDFIAGGVESLSLAEEKFDVIALIFAHFLPEKTSTIHQKLLKSLRKGGVIIFEAYSKSHLSYREKNPEVGGPGNLDMLFSKADIERDFEGFEIIMFEETETKLNEGKYHQGLGSVLRFVGRKNSFPEQ
mgnify:CR=1 FL=1